MIGILNYGSGNVTALKNSFQKIGKESKLISANEDFSGVTKLILPGVGSISSAMKKLNSSGLRNRLESSVQKYHIPVLGICVGLQMLFEQSEEGNTEGLSFIKGKVTRLSTYLNKDVRLPHIGWNEIQIRRQNSLLKTSSSSVNSKFYFLHSFVVDPIDKDIITAETLYEGLFPVSVESENIFGVQFHPEKSHEFGTNLLRSYANYTSN